MKTMTKNQKYFGILVLIFSVTFFYYLYSALKTEVYNNIWLYAIAFGILLFTSGLVLGYNDSVRESRTDIGFQYHIITFIVVNIIGIPWLFITMGININTMLNVTLQIMPWGLGLLLHYYFSSTSIKGMNKKVLFD